LIEFRDGKQTELAFVGAMLCADALMSIRAIALGLGGRKNG